ncbi:hypothetical protein MKK88_05855 [Methylobacterium sp. E-005]|uniref:hypothetical protein n=1 Tax=Methylobacterium sp. E-005 TaxID=2836549 RepID=UPI001FB8B58A|nr:hypothetical protein [Methylobacterium sp. E-005]MCJ2085519.1 hypothetical protein [Methylobacterium sp. E-005]
MAHETVPADIAAAIENLMISAEDMGASYDAKGFPDAEREQMAEMYRSALNVTILKHLRNADENKAALERIEQGV